MWGLKLDHAEWVGRSASGVRVSAWSACS